MVGMALVPLAADVCVLCSCPVDTIEVREPALIRHGGYGGTRVTTYAVCPACKHVRLVSVDEESPRRA